MARIGGYEGTNTSPTIGGANSGISSATYSTFDGSWTVISLENTDPGPEQVAIDVCGLVHRS